MKSIKKSILLLFISYCSVSWATNEDTKNALLERGVDYAAEKAAQDIIDVLSKRNIDVGNIAFLPLFNDERNLYTVVRNELSSIESNFRFFMRESDDLTKLVKEISFGELRSDIMNKSTIQKFGSIEGVDALLYGEVREAGKVNDEQFIVRLSVVLADVETGQQLASANVRGLYSIDKVIKEKVKEPTFSDKAGKILEQNLLKGLDENSEKILVGTPGFLAENFKTIVISIGVIILLIAIKSVYKRVMSNMERPR